ncbi:hypothetical protein [Aliivibrio fischeri]|uniref:hypothetical protein n=1 Tax=Aliivibrio fischeri TaxID=668 RepID=UPI001F439C0D|nr:hypothetical protein [Aliivibrio fischeri]MCE7534591.1 hypothetical protein [Aliivibrio fischeri]MCE7554061.1 hypothetical protein [Aliivibrio fischeri]MCE7557573.1 hypothetical protein [Aliivibrio fischeri]MCE7561087.1 hypothetical protein [Aliivibrio fischeri]MCE7568495.1 hypothetical protein [Aliivibrio fischeri]
MKKTEKVVDLIKTIKRDKVVPLKDHLAFRPTFNIDCYREAVLHRFIDLCEGALLLSKSGNYVAAVVSARAAQESFAIIAYLSFKLEAFEKDHDLAELLNTMHRLSIGWKGDDEFPEMINVLTCIDKVSKMLDPEFRNLYNTLSESAHPNYQGVLGAYSTPNYETKEVVMGTSSESDERLSNLVVTTIQVCALLFEHIQEEFETRMNIALDICIDLHAQGKLTEIFYAQ